MKTQPKPTTVESRSATPPATPAAAPVPATQPPAPAVPDWVTETPRDFDYDLMLYDEYDGQRQHIALTRAEYIAVKRYLAGMRGLVPVPAPAEPAAEPDATEQEVRARLAQQLAGMDACSIELIAWYADIEEADCGSDTPAENLIRGLVISNHVRSLTPDDAARGLEEFRENFDCMAKAARNFTARYPEAVKPAAAA